MKSLTKTNIAIGACALVLGLTLVVPGGVAAQEAEEPEQPAAAAPTQEVDTGDNAWILTSSALVLMMTGPGLALFYSGLVRKKNVLGVIMQCVFLMGLMTVIWALWGYSLSFGGSGRPLLGNADFLLMRDVQLQAGGITWALAIVATFILLKVLDAVMGLRVSHQEEIQGLDLSQHGEEGYIFI